jgi:hypothetical protein
MFKAIAALALTIAIIAAPAQVRALDCPTPYLCFLNGNWVADGTSFGKPASNRKARARRSKARASTVRSRVARTMARGSTAKAQCIR